jgi:hypothetical protein
LRGRTLLIVALAMLTLGIGACAAGRPGYVYGSAAGGFNAGSATRAHQQP